MADVLIIGGGICGLGTALLLARDGHTVTVLERDAAPLPASPQAAWEEWERKGIAQFRQPHNFMPGMRLILETELPDVQGALFRAGASRLDFVHPLPPFFSDQSSRSIDNQLWTYTARRPAGEWVFANAALNEPGVTIRRGVRAAGLLSGSPTTAGVPHVAGVQTAASEQLRADLVIDAMGRRSRSPEWLVAIGAHRPYEEQADCGFTYYTRYFRGSEPARVGPVFTVLGTIGVLTLPGDNGTWSVTVMLTSGDGPLKRLRHTDTWMKALRACPLTSTARRQAVAARGARGARRRYRRFVVDGTPVATGFIAVADAWACTNPSAGRGEYICTITPIQDILRRPDVARRVRAATQAMGDAAPMQLPGPDRAQLLELVA